MRYIWTSFFCLLLLFAINSCQKEKDEHSLTVAATAIPHAELLEQVKADLAKEGVNLHILIVDDYNIPNRALADGDIDANFFQTEAFLQSQMAQFAYPLIAFAKVHIEPMGLYSLKFKNPSSLPEGAIVGIPADPSNQARALLLLEQQGLLQLSRHDIGVSVLQISDNPKKLKLVEIDAPLLARALDDVDLAAINTNFALQAGLAPQKDALATDSSDALFANILVIRAGEEHRKGLKLLRTHLTSKKLAQYIQEHYQGALIPIEEK